MKVLYSSKTLIAVGLVLIVAAIFLHFKLERFISVDWMQALVEQNFWQAIAAFVVLYLILSACNLPGTGALMLSAGFLFGFSLGALVVSFASAIGALLSALIVRFMFRAWAEKRFAGFMDRMHKGIEADGAIYLFTIRMIPLIPFFIVNPVFGLSRMSMWTFYIVTQLGMLPIILIYVNLGATVGDIEDLSFKDALSPQLILALTLLVALPPLFKKLISLCRYTGNREDAIK